MEVDVFIHNYREAFGESAELPIVFWYSDEPVATPVKVNGCLFKAMASVRAGSPISVNEETLGCGGGKFYTGFIDMPEHIPNFVSLKEKYKKSPDMVADFIDHLGVPRAEKEFLNFARIDGVGDFNEMEGLLFLATPDVLSGLATWAYYDNNSDGAVSTLFGSGCSIIVTQAILENRNEGRRTFIGLFDPSVRPYVEPDRISFTIPAVRFREMYYTIRDSCLFDTHAWGKIRNRLNDSPS